MEIIILIAIQFFFGLMAGGGDVPLKGLIPAIWGGCGAGAIFLSVYVDDAARSYYLLTFGVILVFQGLSIGLAIAAEEDERERERE